MHGVAFSDRSPSPDPFHDTVTKWLDAPGTAPSPMAHAPAAVLRPSRAARGNENGLSRVFQLMIRKPELKAWLSLQTPETRRDRLALTRARRLKLISTQPRHPLPLSAATTVCWPLSSVASSWGWSRSTCCSVPNGPLPPVPAHQPKARPTSTSNPVQPRLTMQHLHMPKQLPRHSNQPPVPKSRPRQHLWTDARVPISLIDLNKAGRHMTPGLGMSGACAGPRKACPC